MNRKQLALFHGMLLGAAVLAGCESSQKTTATTTTGGGSKATDATGAMIDSDTQAAQDAVKDRRNDSRADGPVAPRDRRAGGGVVDQPRVVPPPANTPVRR